VLLAAHGSRAAGAANERVREIARALQQRADFADVAAGFHLGEPGFRAALERLRDRGATRIVVVPMMASAGYFATVVLPREIARAKVANLSMTPVLGTCPEIVLLARRRLESLLAGARWEPERASLAVVGHGTRRHPGSRKAAANLVAYLDRSFSFASAGAFYLDEEPTVERILDTGRGRTVVFPFLIGGGEHELVDLPRRLGLRVSASTDLPLRGISRHQEILVDSALGSDPGLVDVVITLVRNCRAGVEPRPDLPATLQCSPGRR
jgi:sirohydrochlorin cobaltochelatase